MQRLKIHCDPVDKDQIKEMVSANNSPMKILGSANLNISLQGLILPHTFLVLDTLHHNCLFGLDFLQQFQAKLDFTVGIATFCDDLVALPLINSQSSRDILRLKHSLKIPPQCEVLSEVIINHNHPLRISLIEPLPTLGGRMIGLARSIVEPKFHTTVCRLLNPTNATIFLPARTPVALISDIDLSDPDNGHLFKTQKNSDFVSSVSETDTLTHDQRLQALQNLGLKMEKDKITDEQFERLTSFLYSNRDLFATDLADLPGTDIVLHEIETTTNIPVRQRQFRHAPHLEKEIDRQCKKMLDANIIRESQSPWNSPIFLLKKKNNEYRFVCDYRKLNAITVPKFHPLPTLENCLDLVGQEQPTIFSVCDQKSGYYSIKMHPDSVAKTAFSTRSSHYEFLRLPFGCQGATTTYVMALSKLLHRELQENALLYLDDLILFSKSFDKHLELLEKVFAKFRTAHLRMNPEKSKFGLSHVQYLGFQFSEQGISMDKNKIAAVQTYPRPTSAKQLRSYLGLTNFWKRFICSYSAITQPLRKLLQNNVKFEWGQEQEQAFNELKSRLCSSPILAFPNLNKPFVITTDACRSGLGYILSQLDDEGRERVISYNGRATKPYEKNYTASDLKMAAIMQALITYHPYIATQRFTIVTDHISLQYIQKLKLGPSRLIRYSLMLSQYQFDIRHCPGSKLKHADALSRREYPAEPEGEPLMDLEPDTFLMSISENATNDDDNKFNDKTVKTKLSQLRLQLPVPHSVSLDRVDSTATQQIVNVGEPINIQTQQDCSYFADIIKYLQSNELPTDRTQARRIVIQSENFVIDDNVLIHLGINRHKRWRLKDIDPIIRQVCVPVSQRMTLLESFHAQLAHAGADKTFLTLRNSYFWASMYTDTRNFVLTCMSRNQNLATPQEGTTLQS